MTHLELLNLNIINAYVTCLNFYINNLIKNLNTFVLCDILNFFYSLNLVLTTNKRRLEFNFITLKIQESVIFLNILFIIFLINYFSYIFIVLFVLFLLFSQRFIQFSSVLLNILHDDSELDNEETEDLDLDESTDNKLCFDSYLNLLNLDDCDDNELITILLSILKKNIKNSEDNICITPSTLIDKLMLSSNLSFDDFCLLKKKINSNSWKTKNNNLISKKFYSLFEVFKLIRSLNKIKNSILILPNGLVILATDTQNLDLFSMQAVLKISKKSLNQIVLMLNLKKKLNLYLTKECYNLGYMLEKSFFASDFLVTFDENFNKDYLILENLKINPTDLLKFKLDNFYCDDIILEEIGISLNNIKQLLSTKCYSKKKNTLSTDEFCLDDVKLNKVSPDLLLENLIKTPTKPKDSKKQYWVDKLKGWITFIKDKFRDLTLPTLLIYYLAFKLLFVFSIKNTLAFLIILLILYKFVYLSNNFWRKYDWLLWWSIFFSYIYYLYLLIFNDIKLLVKNFLHYLKLCYGILRDINFVYILLIYIFTTLPAFLTVSDIKDHILYELYLYVNNWLINKVNGWTFVYIYFWPFIFICKNIYNFAIYALNTSYYRDPIISYFSQFLAIAYFCYYPSVIYEKTINVGRISGFLRWLYWNPHILKKIKIKIKKKIKNLSLNYLTYIYTLFKNFVSNFFKQLIFFFNLVLSSTLIKNILIYLILYIIAILIFLYLLDKFIKLSEEEEKNYNGYSSYYGISDTFGDNVKEKLFDLIPLRYKIRFESFNLEWLKVLNYTLYFYLKYLNMFFNFSVKNLWLYFKHIIYTKYVGSLIEFYCEVHLWIEYYSFKVLGGFFQPFFYIPHYVDHTTTYIIEIPWFTFMDMYKLTEFFGVKPLINSIKGYGQYRTTLLWYQYLFWKNYKHEFNKKKNFSLHVYMLLYWKLYIHYQIKQRTETKDRIFKSWYIWWDKNDIF